MTRDIYEEVTNKIITQLEEGAAPWRKPWREGPALPFMLPVNKTTGKHYRGINIPLLWLSSEINKFQTHDWGSFNQWKDKNESIRKGEKGTMIVFYDTFEKEDRGEIKKVPFLKTSVVFNRSQLQSFKPDAPVIVQEPLVKRIEVAEQFIQNTGAEIKYDGGARNYYRPSTDDIHLVQDIMWIDTPTQTATEAKYSTTFHELVHWSGHKSRINREMGKRFGDDEYAMEELVAELGAAFTCAALQITDGPRHDHADYLASWLDVLKEDKKAILTASSEASKACDYLREKRPEPVVLNL